MDDIFTYSTNNNKTCLINEDGIVDIPIIMRKMQGDKITEF